MPRLRGWARAVAVAHASSREATRNCGTQGEEFVHLHPFNIDILPAIAGEGLQVLRCINQPAQDGVRIDLKDARHGTDAEAFGQSRESPHQLVRIDLLAVNRNRIVKRFQDLFGLERD